VPLQWEKKSNLNELLDYVINLKQNQISIKNFSNLATENPLDSLDLTEFKDRKIPSVRRIIDERCKTVYWLIKICKKFHLKNETLFKGISLLDYYLSRTTKKILRIEEEISFIAVVCLNIACKFEEINCNFMIFFKDNLLEKGVYELKDLIKKEIEILKTLQFKISIPNFYQINNSLMQVAIHNLFNYNDCAAEPQDIASVQIIVNELIKHNEFITKKYAILKESVFSSALNSGIVCFKMTLIRLKLYSNFSNNDFALINDSVDSFFLSKIFKADYIQRCEIVASHLFNGEFSMKSSGKENSDSVSDKSFNNFSKFNNNNNNNNRDMNINDADINCKKEDFGFCFSSSFAGTSFPGGKSMQVTYN